jgi:hypothetical protein
MSMPSLTIRRRKTTPAQKAAAAAGKAGSAAWTFLKARVAWAAGKKATKVAVPAAAVGTAAVVAKKRASHGGEPTSPPAPVDSVPTAPAGVA